MEYNFRKILGGALIGLVGFFGLGFVWPIFGSIRVYQAALIARETALAEKTALIDQVKRLDSEAQTRKAEVDRLAELLPEDENSKEVLVSLDTLARESGLFIRNFKSSIRAESGGQIEGGQQILNVETVVSGTYPSFFTFMNQLEKSLRIFDVKEISISEKELSGPAGKILDFSLRIETYFNNGEE